MNKAKNIIKALVLPVLVVLIGCSEDEYVVPGEFTDLSITWSSGAAAVRESQVNQFFSFMDMSAGATHQEWRIPKSAFFLQGPIPNNLESHDEYIIDMDDTVSTDRTVHVLWTKGDTATQVGYYATFRDSTSFVFNAYWDSDLGTQVEDTIKTEFVGGEWVAEYSFILDVYDTVVAVPQIRHLDGTVVDHENTESITLTVGDQLEVEDLSAFLEDNNARPDYTKWRAHTFEGDEDNWEYYELATQTRDGDFEKKVVDVVTFNRAGQFKIELTARRERTDNLKQSEDIIDLPITINVVE